ncbi:hypothetical protein [Yersinia aldovae]|uniref:Uncharacterized protein n=1 Tax=Yersinia aldovae TaxID=29483 RepID=A0ABM9SUJ5_YERAL|nr:hypothetical protein [Yersinia aldovae]CNK98795.1 Uncharacterised protein [Yersinia aldovae]
MIRSQLAVFFITAGTALILIYGAEISAVAALSFGIGLAVGCWRRRKAPTKS